jgi:Protein of unknown function (DUF2934)
MTPRNPAEPRPRPTSDNETALRREPELPRTAAPKSSVESVPPAPDKGIESRIRELAYRLYEQRSRRDGHDVQDWLEAEAIIRGRRNIAA